MRMQPRLLHLAAALAFLTPSQPSIAQDKPNALGLSQEQVAEFQRRIGEYILENTEYGTVFELIDQGRFREAEIVLRRFMAQFEPIWGTESPGMATMNSTLGVILMRQGRFNEARALFERSFGQATEFLGRDNPATLTIANNLALLEGLAGNIARAEQIHLDTITRRESQLGPNHADTLQSLVNLGELLLNQGRNTEAEPIFARVMESDSGNEGEIARLLAQAILARSYLERGLFDEAEPLLLDTLERQADSRGRTNPEYTYTLVELGELYRRSGQLDEAERYLDRALTTTVRTQGGRHPVALSTRSRLASLYSDQRRYSEAQALYRDIVDPVIEIYGTSTPAALITARNSIFFSLVTDADAADTLRIARTMLAGLHSRRGRLPR